MGTKGKMRHKDCARVPASVLITAKDNKLLPCTHSSAHQLRTIKVSVMLVMSEFK